MTRTLTQFARYAVIGLASNAIAFLLYLALTHFGLGHKLSMTLLYGIGVLQTFVFNKRWTFAHRGEHGPVFLRYCLAYAAGYLINLGALLVLVDRHGFAHQAVQGVMVLALAVMLFLLQKYWVFRPAGRPVLSKPRGA
jgi:putative flippase GtrA